MVTAIWLFIYFTFMLPTARVQQYDDHDEVVVMQRRAGKIHPCRRAE